MSLFAFANFVGFACWWKKNINGWVIDLKTSALYLFDDPLLFTILVCLSVRVVSFFLCKFYISLDNILLNFYHIVPNK